MKFKQFAQKATTSLLGLMLCLVSCDDPTELVNEPEVEVQSVKATANANQIANKGVQKNLTPNVFIKNGVGYQGPSQSVINTFPKFVVDELPKHNATQRIQAAIDQASARNGGRVIIRPGKYIVKEINLKSNVHIRLKPNVIMVADQRDQSPAARVKHKDIFLIGRRKNIKNVSIVGEGKGQSRPKFRYFRESKRNEGGVRAFSVNGVKNCFIQNVLIEDNETRFAGIDFNFNFSDVSKAGRPTNVTIDNCEIKKGAYGYGLVQLNCGLNVLLSNLTGEGGITARIESDNRTFKSKTIGIDNAHVRNVLTINGNTSVLLQPWNVVNGNVFIDGAYAINCNFAVESQDGYQDTTGKGRFGPNSSIKNVAAVYGLTATGHFAHEKAIPNCLLRFFKKNEPSPDAEESGARVGPSICVVGDFVTREANRVKVFGSTVSATVPNNTNPANTVNSRVDILTGNAIAHRGNDPNKQCGWRAYN
ncbi:hypothetical protein SAMN05421766_11119 [Zobellia uliginosa]|uniref:Right handed beta helix region n=1 Tax=Zobellia uliginosa TaxID=143224 RepID=A0ABY1L245_9FLAO|nr:hypothetical protein [Zobellia uliginosa]SIT11606.1 hypothetical protein SAMN05421766_11119 [Zobellia uliginosa]